MEKLNAKEWSFLVALGITGISIFLPFVSILGFSVSLATTSGLSYIVLLIAAAGIGLFFWKKTVGAITALVGSILLLISVIVGISSMSSSLDTLGTLGANVSTFSLLSFGAYLLIIGIIATLILSIVLLKDLYTTKGKK